MNIPGTESGFPKPRRKMGKGIANPAFDSRADNARKALEEMLASAEIEDSPAAVKAVIDARH